MFLYNLKKSFLVRLSETNYAIYVQNIPYTMNNRISDIPKLKKILWADFLLGGGTAMIGLLWYPYMAIFLGLPTKLVVFIASITLGYALLAFRLAQQTLPAIWLLRGLVYANWIWTIISIALLISYFNEASAFGVAFLLLQVAVVSSLAYLEGRHISLFKA